MLGAVAGNTVELGPGQLDLSIAQVAKGLHGALAEGGAAEYQAATVILNGTGEDFRSRSGEPVDQYGQRAIVEGADFGIAKQADTATGVAYLYGGPTVDEQAEQGVGFLQGAATVVAQIEYQTVDTLLLEALDFPRDVTGGTAELFGTGLPGVKVHIEGGNGNHADALGITVALDFDNLALGSLVFQIYGVTGDFDSV